jgi:hypothetical protein
VSKGLIGFCEFGSALGNPLFQLVLRCTEFVVRLLSLRQVAGDLAEAPQHAVPIPQRGDDHVGPEPRAILAKPPPFLLVPSRLGRYLQLPGGMAPLDIPGQVERREMLPDDLRRTIALDALRPQVPGEDIALWVEHEDRVIPHARHKQSQRLWVPMQCMERSRWPSALRAVGL